MTDADISEFLVLSKPRVGSGCKVADILARLKPADRKKLHAALAHEQVTHISIITWLAARGESVADSTLGKHRRHECRCPHD